MIELKIHLTDLSHKEIKKIKSEDEKSFFLDMNKLIEFNFGTNRNLSDTQYWILNQMMVKKIEGFLASKYDVIYIKLDNPTKERLKALKELVSDNDIRNVTVTHLK